MTIDGGNVQKRTYSTPKLFAYGDMATLTRSLAGSLVEVTGMAGMMRRP